jgi:hypothetical protein
MYALFIDDCWPKWKMGTHNKSGNQVAKHNRLTKFAEDERAYSCSAKYHSEIYNHWWQMLHQNSPLFDLLSIIKVLSYDGLSC